MNNAAEKRFLQIQETYQQLTAARRALALLRAQRLFAVGITVDFGQGLTPVAAALSKPVADVVLVALEEELAEVVADLEQRFDAYRLA